MENTAKKQRARGRPFPPGTSGNPRGRPKGARNKRTLMMERLMQEEFENPVDLSLRVNQTIEEYFDRLKFVTHKDVQLAIATQRACVETFLAILQAHGQRRGLSHK